LMHRGHPNTDDLQNLKSFVEELEIA